MLGLFNMQKTQKITSHPENYLNTVNFQIVFHCFVSVHSYNEKFIFSNICVSSSAAACQGYAS